MKHIPRPTEKAPDLEAFLTMITGRDRRKCILSRTCMVCGQDAIDFRDDNSFREFEISGMCQSCQDLTFVPDTENT